MENKNRQKILIIAVVAIIGLYLAQSVIYTPLVNAWTSRQKKIKELQDAVSLDNSLIRKSDSIIGRWRNMQTSALPGDLSQAQSGIVKAVDRWAQSSGVTTESIAPNVRQDPDEKDSSIIITTVECRVEATGTMNSLLNFLYAIGREKMGTKLDNVELATKDTTGQQLTMGLTISALVLGAPQPESASAPAPAKTEADQ